MPTLVWGFCCQALFKRFLAFLVATFRLSSLLFSFFVRPQDRFFVPTCRGAVTPSAAAVKDGRRSVERETPGSAGHALTAASTVSRWGGSGPRRLLVLARGSAGLRPSIRGEPAVRRRPSPHNLVFGESQMADSNHDAVMRIGGRLLGGGSILQKRH